MSEPRTGTDGRGRPNGRRGRRASADDHSRALFGAMDRLLELGGVDADSRFVEVDGHRLYYLDAGSGWPVVLIQGAGGGAANWYRIMGPLATRFRVLALDLPGFGHSTPRHLHHPLGRGTAAIVRDWLHAVGVDACDVLGTSFGGLVALRLAQDVGLRVRRLALMDSVGLGRELPWLLRAASFPGLWRLATPPSRRRVGLLFRRQLTGARLDPAHEDALIDYLWHSAAAGDYRLFARSLARFATVRGQREVLTDPELEALDLPVLILWGERDEFLPFEHARRAAEHIPRSVVVMVPGAGHSPNWEAPQVVLEALVPFLTDRRTAPMSR